MDFLAESFELGFEYSTINTQRSAISAFHEPTEGFFVGKHLKVCNLMAVVYKKRPPKPRYCFGWDVETVLRYLKSIPVNKLLSTKMLTLKLTLPLALTSASKCSETRHLDIRFYTKSERKFCFNVIKPTKTSKANKILAVLEFERFQDDNNVCVSDSLEEYIFRAKPWHEKSNHNQLLLSHIEPHSPVKTCRLSRWICQVLKYKH